MYRLCFTLPLLLFSLLVTGTPDKGKKPKIVGQNAVSTLEEQPKELSTNDLIIEFEEDDGEGGEESLTLEVSDGNNYTVEGSTVIPTKDFNGTLKVPVRVEDGDDKSNMFQLDLEVLAVNDPPTITGHVALATSENQPITLSLGDLYVTDPDNTYPQGFTMSVAAGANYTVSGTTVTPNDDFFGILYVPVTVNDGTADSAPFTVEIQVSGGNDAPVITGQSSLQTAEDQPITISLSHLTVNDPDDAYPDQFTLTVSPGTNYTVAGNTVYPDPNYSGSLSVPVRVNDGTSDSAPFNLLITVTAANDAPVITGQQPLAISENQSLTLAFAHLTVTDADNTYPSGFSLSIAPGANYTVSGNVITPSAGFSGTLSVPVTVNDGGLTSNSFALQIQVTATNDPPVITGQTTLQTVEEQPLTITLGNLYVTDPDNAYPTGFTLSVSGGANYVVSGTTITPVADFSGTLTVPVTVNDGTSTSAPFNLQVEVLPQNDAPIITGQQPLSTPEEQPITIALGHLTITDNDNSDPSSYTLTVGAGENYTVAGNTITPAVNFNGVLTVPVTVSDGSNTSPVFSLAVTVTPVNDAPVILSQVPLSVPEGSTITLQLSNYTVSDPDNTYPNGFTLAVAAGSNYTVSGTTVTPAAGFSGSLTVGVTVSDGLASSAVFNTIITVSGVNDAPVITGQIPVATNEDQPFTILLSHLTVTDTDNTYPTGFTLAVLPGTNYTVTNNTIIPAANFSGVLTVPVSVNDGMSNSNTFNLQITVAPVNDLPVITAQTVLSTQRNKTIAVQLSDLTVTDPDNTYPTGFTMQLSPGPNYTVFENTITPANNFTGTLNVPVTVNDGVANSAPFVLKIEVTVPPNVPPVIVSQAAITTYENQPISLTLANLVVNDPDNKYPDDFTLQVFPGENYSLNGNEVIPKQGYSGPLRVRVTVSDGQSTSEPFLLSITVLPITDTPLITSQAFIRLSEDDSLTLKFSDVVVIDPDNTYPTGFTMMAAPGENYTVKGLQIKPEKDYSGYLTVPVTVNDGVNTSASYQLLILVEAVNDAPAVTDSEPGDLFFTKGGNPVYIFEDFVVTDVDDDSLFIAEVSITAPGFKAGEDTLMFENTANLRGIYDRAIGTLVIFGTASVAEYEEFIRNISYDFTGEINPSISKNIALTLSDGKAESKPIVKVVSFGETGIALDIPSGFTPNGDGSNDTWTIKSEQDNADYSDAIVRVYNKRGAVVFESRGLTVEWDGRMNGVLLPADTYFYTVDLQGGFTTNRYKGVVTLLR